MSALLRLVRAARAESTAIVGGFIDAENELQRGLRHGDDDYSASTARIAAQIQRAAKAHARLGRLLEQLDVETPWEEAAEAARGADAQPARLNGVHP